jgi:hypothetical protein
MAVIVSSLREQGRVAVVLLNREEEQWPLRPAPSMCPR